MSCGHPKKEVKVGGGPPGVRCRAVDREAVGNGCGCLSEIVGIEYRQPNSLGPVEVIRSNQGQCLLKSHSNWQETTQARNGAKREEQCMTRALVNDSNKGSNGPAHSYVECVFGLWRV